MTEGEGGDDLFIIRSGSMVVEKSVGGKQVFLSYVPAGSYSGEMALLDGGPRTATVKAAIRSQVVRLPGEPFRRLLAKKRKDLYERFFRLSRVDGRGSGLLAQLLARCI